LKALDEGWIAGAGIDVFTSEPPKPDSTASRLSKHPKVVATPHLGASTVEAQENVSMDVCTQVLEILRGGLPTAAVNAPLILPEEYRKLQPFVRLIEKMGGLYTQHFVGSKGGMIGGRKFELIYQGELAAISNTRPLFAALVKGLVSSISDSQGRDVNIVNATLTAKEKGIVIKESHSHESKDLTYASVVTLLSYDERHKGSEQVIEGYVSGKNVFISKLDRFNATFRPQGTLLILHNYDEPGKIGGVGTVLGRHSINIKFMQVASLDLQVKRERAKGALDALAAASELKGDETPKNGNDENEALMILGVAGVVSKDVLDDLNKSEGILAVSLVQL
jgi:D-3-phosphoglycerate dehydrogenase / 2-oxoglutarate reductase